MLLKETRVINSSSGSKVNLNTIPDPFIIVAIPGSVHIVELCRRFIPPQVNVILVSNGLDDWEQHWVDKHLNFNSVIKIKSLVRHGTILDFLLDQLTEPFGILDYDCFILDPSVFSEITRLRSTDLVNGLFPYHNPVIDIRLPETFCLFINTQIINEIRQKYHASCNQLRFYQLPGRIKKQLATIGIDKDHQPEHYKRVIDTLKLVLSLGLSEGYQCNFIKDFSLDGDLSQNVLHIGGTSLPNYEIGPYQLRGSYFWRRALDVHPDGELREYYHGKYGRKTAAQLLEEYPHFPDRVGAAFFDMIEMICSRK